jgi:hypothetical protein
LYLRPGLPFLQQVQFASQTVVYQQLDMRRAAIKGTSPEGVRILRAHPARVVKK